MASAAPRRRRRWPFILGAFLVALIVVGFAVVWPAIQRHGTTGGPHNVPVPASTAVDPEILGHLQRVRSAASGAAFPSPARPQAPATVWAVGDGANGSDGARRLANVIARGRPERVLYLGDVYERGTADEFLLNFAGVYGGLVPITVPTPGNHEWANRASGYDPYWQSVTGHPTRHWFALTIGGWRVLSLNSEDPGNTSQLAFIDRELAAHDDRCVIAMYHRPRENAGSHGDNPSVEPLWQRVKGRAALTLSGHDHDLQRLRPVDGTTQYVIGAGGQKRYGLNADDPRLEFGRDNVFGALELRLRPGRADLAIVDSAGKVLDRSSATCGA